MLGGLCVLLAHSLVRRIVDRGSAHVLALLLATSPWFLWVNASFMTHAITLALCLGGWRLVAQRTASSAFLGGLCMGLICLVRPLDGLAVGVLTGLWALGLGGKRLPFFALATYAFGCVAGAATLLGYNYALTGDPLFFPINDYLDRLWYTGANSIGFGADKGNPGGWNLDPLAGHGPWDVLYNTNQNLYYFNFELLGWCVGSLLPLAVHLVRGKFKGPRPSALRLPRSAHDVLRAVLVQRRLGLRRALLVPDDLPGPVAHVARTLDAR